MTYVLHVDFYASFAQIDFRFPEYFRENLNFFAKPNILFQPRSSPPNFANTYYFTKVE
jgi:hypothetical protein